MISGTKGFLRSLAGAGNGRRRRQWPRRSPLWDFAWVVGGAALVGVVFNTLLMPNAIPPGGVVGVSVVVNHALGIEPAYLQWTLNLGLLFFSGLFLGRGIVMRSLLGALMVPLFVFLTRGLEPATHNVLLAAICGGVGVGAGIGCIFRGNGAPGGFGSLALLLFRKAGAPVGRTMFILDASVLLSALTILPAEAVLSGAIAVFMVARTAQLVLSGLDTSKVAFIISKETQVIEQVVLADLDLGLTKLEAHGGYTGEQRSILMVVMRPSDVFRLKAAVSSYDPEAFIILTDASEVLGHGFKPH